MIKKMILLFIAFSFLLTGFSSFAFCQAKIKYYKKSGEHIATLYLRTYRHGFLYHRCSVIKAHEKYLTNILLQKKLCAEKIKGCCQGESCRTQLIFKQGWPFFGHH